MITFLPFPNIKKSVEALDVETLKQQRVEARTILDILRNKHSIKGMKFHPAVRMWSGSEEMLGGYLEECMIEYVRRGRINNMAVPNVCYAKMRIPLWWGGITHGTHRAALLKNNPNWYSQFGWKEVSSKIYWPIKGNGKLK